MRTKCKALFYLKPTIDRAPMKWGRQPVIRSEHYILIAVDSCSTVDRPATFMDALEYPREMTLYRRRLGGPLGGKRRARKSGK